MTLKNIPLFGQALCMGEIYWLKEKFLGQFMIPNVCGIHKSLLLGVTSMQSELIIRKKLSNNLLLVLVILIAVTNLGYGQAPKLPETLEERVDAAARAIPNGIKMIEVKNYLIQLGPNVVPVITQKLQQSLAEGSSPEGALAVAMLDMPHEDQKRANYQIGLVTLQGVAIREIPLNPTDKEKALNSLYSTLKSPYMISRKSALYAAANSGNISAVDEIIPLLNDKDLSNRVIAAQMLAKIGDASTADKVAQVLEKRRQGLTAEQVEKDWSFRHGYEAIELLRKKINQVGSQAQTQSETELSTPPPTPSASPSPTTTATTNEAPYAGFPTAPIAILIVVVSGAIVLLLRRKSQ